MGLMIAALSGCSEAPYPLPDRTSPAVQAEESRLATLLPGALLWAPGSCEVRLLGTEGSSSFAWAECMTNPTADLASGGFSKPVRVDGEQVRGPVDGTGHKESIEALFPQRLADAVLNEPERLYP